MAGKKDTLKDNVEFAEAFLEQVVIARKKIGKTFEDHGIEEEISLLEGKMMPSIIKKEEFREEFGPLTLEEESKEERKKRAKVKKRKKRKVEEAEEIEAVPMPGAPPAEEKLPIPEPPIYKRHLPPLPLPPPAKKEWPLPQKAEISPEETVAHVEFPEFPRVAQEKAQQPPPPPPKKIEPAPERPPMALIPLDLGKLNPLIMDPKISLIECDGAQLPIRITRDGRPQEIKLSLSEDEIRTIIQKFEARTGEPLTEPIFKTQVGGIIFTAVTSAFTGSKFVISKV
ncbi:MAG: hypothetical protein K6T16_03040 [Candidatus Pacearchaeota archaeon]|nr:hypothetical protein [Candidatus Pacearchaeota archaeon]